MIAFESVIESMLIEARAASLDGEILELEPNQFGDCITYVMDRLRKAEKDSARYRFMRDMSDNIDVSGFFWIDVSERDAFVDEAMQCK